jgi:hypothetical protein
VKNDLRLLERLARMPVRLQTAAAR